MSKIVFLQHSGIFGHYPVHHGEGEMIKILLSIKATDNYQMPVMIQINLLLSKNSCCHFKMSWQMGHFIYEFGILGLPEIFFECYSYRFSGFN